VKESPARQISKISINTRYLRAGKNEIEFTFGKKNQYQYKCKKGSACVGYTIHKMWFEDFGGALTTATKGQGLKPTGNPILRLETGMHSAVPLAADVDAESRYLVTGSIDKTVRVWDLVTKKLVQILRPPIDHGSEGEIRAVAISPDGKTIACGGVTGKSWETAYSVYLFDRRSGELIRRLKGIDGEIHHLAYSKDGRFLAVGFGKGVCVYQTPAYAIVGQDITYGLRCSCADFKSNQQLATASFDGYIRLYKLSADGLKCIAIQKAPSGNQILSLKFSTDGRKLAIGYLKDKQSPPVIDVISGNNLKYLYSPDTSGLWRHLKVVAWSVDEKVLYAGGFPFKKRNEVISPIFKWSDGGTGFRMKLRAARFPIQCICSLKNGGIAFVSYDTAWGIIDAQDQRGFFQKPAIANFAGHKKGFQISPDATRVLFSYKPRFRVPALFDVEKRSVELVAGLEDDLIWPRSHSPGVDITNWRNSKNPQVNGVKLKLWDTEMSRCLAIAPDGDSFVLGTIWNLYRFDKKGHLIWRIRVSAVAHSVNISQDSQIVVAALGDGTIRWFRIEDGKEFLAFFPHNDRRRWIAWTPEGYYMSSPYGDELIGWHLNNGKDREADFYTAMQFERILYRPDYVQASFHHRGDPGKLKTTLASEIFDIKNLASIAPPKIKIISDQKASTVSSSNITINIAAEKTVLPMQYYTVFVNNIPITAANERILLGSEQDKFFRKVEVPLFGSHNNIRVEVFNGTSLGLARTNITKTGTPNGKPKGNIYLLAVGINKFQNVPNLDYAALDAQNVAKFFKKQQGQPFNQVFAQVISDFSEAEPIKKNILDSLEFLKQARAQDTVIVFLASHGLSDMAGNYYFVPQDAQPNDLENFKDNGKRGAPDAPQNFASLISWESFFDALRSVPGKRLLIVDTCYAKKISGTLDIHSLAKRSASSSFALLAASRGNEQSQEFPQGKQGLFTYALLKGLKGDGDINKDGRVTLSEIYEFVSKFVEENRIKRLGKQTPQLTAPTELKDMVLSN
jgi:WD40 repeat protein